METFSFDVTSLRGRLFNKILFFCEKPTRGRNLAVKFFRHLVGCSLHTNLLRHKDNLFATNFSHWRPAGNKNESQFIIGLMHK